MLSVLMEMAECCWLWLAGRMVVRNGSGARRSKLNRTMWSELHDARLNESGSFEVANLLVQGTRERSLRQTSIRYIFFSGLHAGSAASAPWRQSSTIATRPLLINQTTISQKLFTGDCTSRCSFYSTI